MSDDFDKLEAADDFESVPEGGAEGGAEGPSKPLVEPVRKKTGTAWDTAKEWANTMTAGAAPYIEGAMGAVLQGMGNNAADEAEAMGAPSTGARADPLDAYRDIRDAGKAEHAKSADTWAGQASVVPALLSPIPGVKGLPKGAGALPHAKQAAKVGGTIGAVSGLANSEADLTRPDAEQAKRALIDALVGGAGGAVGGAVIGGAMGAAEKPLRSTARELALDTLGVKAPAKARMAEQGISDAAADDVLVQMKPFRSGMRRGSLTENVTTELGQRGKQLGDVIGATDAATKGATAMPDVLAEAIRGRAIPLSRGSINDKQAALRMEREAQNLLKSLGDKPISLQQAEEFKRRFGPAVERELKAQGEPAAVTRALGETYRALQGANEGAAEAAAGAMAPELKGKFVPAKEAYRRLAAALEGTGSSKSGLRDSDFEWGDALTKQEPPGWLQKALGDVLGSAVALPINVAGRAYGRGVGAKGAEFLADRAASNSGGGVGGVVGAEAADSLAPYLELLGEEEK